MYNVFTQDIDLWAFNTEEGDTSHVLVQSVLGRILFTEGGTLYTSAKCPGEHFWGGGGHFALLHLYKFSLVPRPHPLTRKGVW